MEEKHSHVPRPSLALLAFMMSLGPFGDTEYTPSMPDIAHALSVDYSMVQLTMASYLVGTAVSELFYGPLTDRFGRRPVMLVGAGILTGGAVICLASFAIGPLIAGRLVQGVGACAGGVVAKAAVRDAFPADERERVYAQINAAFALAPAIGPILGSIVAKTMSWHINFAILAALSALLWVLIWRYLPETKLKVNPRALQPRRVWSNFKRPLTAPDFLFYAVIGGCCIGVVYTALIGAPDLVLNVLGLGTVAIIIVAVSILIGFVTGAGLCAWLSKKVSDLYLLAAGLVVMLLGSLGLLAVAFIVGEHGTLAMYLSPIGLCFVGVGLVVPVSTANAMAPFNRIAGSASSLLGCTRMGIAALGTIVMSQLHRSSVYDMPTVFLGLSILAIAILIGYVSLHGLTPTKERAQPDNDQDSRVPTPR